MRPALGLIGWLVLASCAALAGCAAATDGGDGAGGSSDQETSFTTGGDDTNPTCEATVFQGQALPLDLLTVLQVSSLPGQHPDEIKGALQTFAASSEAAGVGMGLTKYPRFEGRGYGTNIYLDCAMLMADQNLSNEGCQDADICHCDSSANGSQCSCWYFDQCEAADYLIPDVEIAPLPAAGLPIEQAISTTDQNERPLGQAFNGATQYLTGWALNHPDQNAAIVLVADGEDSTTFCPGDADAAHYAATVASSAAAIRTYVVALDNASELDPIAAAGGSVAAHDAGVSKLADALEQVRAEARGCAYAIPRPSSGPFDPQRVNVRIQGSDASNLSQVPGADGCASHGGGWYYDDPDDPRKILLCHESCADLGETSKDVEVLVGCPTEVIK